MGGDSRNLRRPEINSGIETVLQAGQFLIMRRTISWRKRYQGLENCRAIISEGAELSIRCKSTDILADSYVHGEKSSSRSEGDVL
jgi:hypothetical protein